MRSESETVDSSIVGVLYIHTFSDYFWNKELAEKFRDNDYSFYALDLRRYGRTYSPQIHPNWTTNLIEYFEEIHLALAYMRRLELMKKIILMGHGLGGLIAILFAERHHTDIDILCLNSPLLAVNTLWTDYTASKRGWFGSKGDPMQKHTTFSQLYHQSLNKHHKGEWTWKEALKPINGFPLFLGWMEMIEDHLKRIQSGLLLKIPIPVCVMVGVRSVLASSTWTDQLKTSDAVIDTEKVITLVQDLSPFVKIVPIPNGIHDLFLSGLEAREMAYTQLFQYLENFWRDIKKAAQEDNEENFDDLLEDFDHLDIDDHFDDEIIR